MTVFMIEKYNQRNDESLPKLVSTDNALSSISGRPIYKSLWREKPILFTILQNGRTIRDLFLKSPEPF